MPNTPADNALYDLQIFVKAIRSAPLPESDDPAFAQPYEIEDARDHVKALAAKVAAYADALALAVGGEDLFDGGLHDLCGDAFGKPYLKARDACGIDPNAEHRLLKSQLV